MNTKGHPLRVAFCIYFKPVSLKKRTLSELPAPLPFFPSQDVRAILPAQWRTTYDGLDLAGRRRFWFSVLDRVTVSAARDIRFTLAL